MQGEIKMVRALSYIIAVIITVALAIILYPIAALFWVFGLLGKLSDGLFTFTKWAISALWRDLSASDQPYTNTNNPKIASGDSWPCACGSVNTGKFCSNCGTLKPQPVAEVEQ